MSITKGDFNEDWKTAIVRPLLKKPGLELTHQTTDLSQTCAFSPTGRVVHVATVTESFHSTRSHTRLPICLQ